MRDLPENATRPAPTPRWMTQARVEEAQHERRLIDALAASFAAHDVVIVSDYGYGIPTPRFGRALNLIRS